MSDYSHHQKFVVMDCPWSKDDEERRTIRVFLGGLDLTQGRFDWPEHPFLPEDEKCKNFLNVTTHSGRQIHDWYNAEFNTDESPALIKDKTDGMKVDKKKAHPRQPWHDIHCQIKGPSAWDVLREFVGRWNVDPDRSAEGDTDEQRSSSKWNPVRVLMGGRHEDTERTTKGDTDEPNVEKVAKLFQKVLTDDAFVRETDDHGGAWNAQILRSMTKDHWGPKTQTSEGKSSQDHKSGEFAWTIEDDKPERSIQDAYLQAISQAEQFIYLETQYFIGSGSQWFDRSRTIHDRNDTDSTISIRDADEAVYNKRPSVSNAVPQALVDRILQKAEANEEFHVYLIIPMFPEGDPASGSGVNQVQRDFQWRSIAYIVQTLANTLPEISADKQWSDYFTFGFLANWANVPKPLMKSVKRYLLFGESVRVPDPPSILRIDTLMAKNV